MTGGELKEGEDLLEFMTDNGPSIVHGTADGTKCKITERGSKGAKPKCETGYTVVDRVSTEINRKNRCNTGNSKEAAPHLPDRKRTIVGGITATPKRPRKILPPSAAWEISM